MRVKMLLTAADAERVLRAGEVVSIPPALAKTLIGNRYAEPVEEEPAAEYETATIEAPEEAVQKIGNRKR